MPTMRNATWCLLALGTIVLMLSACSSVSAPVPSGAMRLQGVDASPLDTTASGTLQSVSVQAGQLTLVVQGFRAPLVVAPWPANLPIAAAFTQSPNDIQTVQVRSAMHPFGPSQSVTVRRGVQTQPWLWVQSGAQSGQKLLDDWTVLYSADQWWLKQGEQRSQLASVQKISALKAQWCVYPTARAASQEVPALLDWVLVQLAPDQAACPR